MQRFLTEAGRLGKSMWHHGPRLESKISGKEEHPAPASTKMIYLFKEGNKNQRELLGGKGANLCEMTNLNMPVPPGFVISTEVCAAYFADKCLPAGFEEEMAVALSAVEMQMGQKFGDVSNPLLLSVRSGAPVSMPGMMDTVLNLGLNDEIVEHLATSSGNERWAFDCYRRFLQMYSDIVLRVDGGSFEKELTSLKEERGALTDADLTVPDLKELVRRFKLLSPNVPTAPMDQLTGAICAVFSSWFNQRAVRYRNYHGITGVKGTAVNIQAMVFGNKNTDSATGVAFSRDPSTGARHFFGEFLEMAEGEDVVAGIRTPQPIDMLKERWPALYQQLWDIQDTLEKHYADMQDIEFTIQDGELFMLQCRSGKRTAKAAVKIAVDMHDEGMLTKAEALRRIPAEKLDFFLHPSIDPTLAAKKSAARGLPASPGAATGAVVFTPDEAHEAATMGLDVILVRRETTPEDIHGMRAAVGILTQYGGMTSHAAVVARGMGKCCVSGCTAVTVNVEAGTATIDGHILRRGDVITLDGSTGNVILGEVERVPAGKDADFMRILDWADEFRQMNVLANVDTPEDARRARQLGGQGIGLCRTEHMFFNPVRVIFMREMILAASVEERDAALEKLYEFQRDDMTDLFMEMDGLPVTIRLLDPPLHEFIKLSPQETENLAADLGKSCEDITERVQNLQEVNPMLGFRGCRLGIVHPEVITMQARAIMAAAIEARRKGSHPHPEIMIPVVSTSTEIAYILPVVKEAMAMAIKEAGPTEFDAPEVRLGTMVELPRACLTAGQLVEAGARFMSFGTNDLTQTTWGISRDDLGAFVTPYIDAAILPGDPFASIDQTGVGELIQIAITRARAVEPCMVFGICGEHGGDPRSVDFFHRAGLDYVSCSPFRIPIARVAAAQAEINHPRGAQREEGKAPSA